jgi:hypothetical protein
MRRGHNNAHIRRQKMELVKQGASSGITLRFQGVPTPMAYVDDKCREAVLAMFEKAGFSKMLVNVNVKMYSVGGIEVPGLYILPKDELLKDSSNVKFVWKKTPRAPSLLISIQQPESLQSSTFRADLLKGYEGPAADGSLILHAKSEKDMPEQTREEKLRELFVRVKLFREKHNMTVDTFCLHCGIGTGSYFRLKNGQSFATSNYKKISAALERRSDGFSTNNVHFSVEIETLIKLVHEKAAEKKAYTELTHVIAELISKSDFSTPSSFADSLLRHYLVTVPGHDRLTELVRIRDAICERSAL